MKKITIDWEVYVLEKDMPKQNTLAKKKKDMEYVIVRTYSAWVFAWYLESRKWQEVVLRNARRLRYRDWAASLSQLSTEWVSKPQNCKFPCEVDIVELLQCIEVLKVTEKAKASIDSVKERKM